MLTHPVLTPLLCVVDYEASVFDVSATVVVIAIHILLLVVMWVHALFEL